MDLLNNSANGSTSNRLNRNADRDDYIVGYSLAATAIVGLIAYIPCLFTMFKSKVLKSSCYTFIISLGICDSVSLVCWVLVGIYTCSHGSIFTDTQCIVIFCFLSFGWKVMKSHEVATAINRYISICHPDKHDRWYSKKKLVAWFVFIYTFGVCENMSSFLPPHMVYSLDNYLAVWKQNVTVVFRYQDLTTCTIVFATCAFCYSAILIKFRKVRKQVTPIGQANKTNNQAIKERNDMMFQFRLAVQTSIRCFTFYIYDILFYVVPGYTDDVLAIYVCGTYLWCVNNAVNPWIYLAFNQQLRKAIRTEISTLKS